MFEPISSTVPADRIELPQDWFFTFGFGHTHPTSGAALGNCYVRINGTCDSTRDVMFAAFGNRWAFQYSEAQKADRIDKHGMTEVALPAASTLDGGQ